MNPHAVPNAIFGLPGKPKNGGSNPRFYEFDDGVKRLVKWHPSNHGAKACYNELLASRLGQLIGAPILRGMVVYVPDAILPADHRNDGAKQGFHFGVTHMDGENFIPAQHLADIENKKQLPSAAILLAWLSVGDQEGHNQFLQRLTQTVNGVTLDKKHYRLIDMGQAFGNWAWTASTVKPVHTSYKLPAHLEQNLSVAALKPIMAELEAVSDEAITSCASDRPEDWKVTDDEVQAVCQRICAARDSLEQIVRTGNPNLK